jgi:hypothetical protein
MNFSTFIRANTNKNILLTHCVMFHNKLQITASDCVTEKEPVSYGQPEPKGRLRLALNWCKQCKQNVKYFIIN